MVYTTIAGDVLDAICYQHYGTEHGTIEAVLTANYGLADQPVILPAGIQIVLPDLVAAEPVSSAVNLWD